MKFTISLMRGAMILVLLGGVHSSIGAPVRPRSAAPARQTALRSIKTLYITRLTGDPVFTSRLKQEIRSMGVRFVTVKSAADALLEGSGNYDKGQFWGRLTLRSHGGKVLWSAQAYRPRGSDYMAYSRLADKLRVALRRD